MKNIFVFIAAALLSTSSPSKAASFFSFAPPEDVPECPKNQRYDLCGTYCPLICGEPEAQMCIMGCNQGCQCPWGWWQKQDGTCVESESECDVHYEEFICPHNQKWFDCGPSCPDVCGEDTPWYCPEKCEMGCFCPWGWWKQEDGSCVETYDECDIDRSCPHNQVWTTCMDCDYYCDGHAECSADCPSGCECPPELPYKTEEGVCIAECPLLELEDLPFPEDEEM